ncbi:MAG: hypothetical protein MK165_02405 [Pirellulaceae bacterium]|nr:hypothetical protein [Pirellulaceae bacterium]
MILFQDKEDKTRKGFLGLVVIAPEATKRRPDDTIPASRKAKHHHQYTQNTVNLR